MTGCLDISKSILDPSDDGGQLDVRFPNGAQCSFGGYGASFIELCVLIVGHISAFSALLTQRFVPPLTYLHVIILILVLNLHFHVSVSGAARNPMIKHIAILIRTVLDAPRPSPGNTNSPNSVLIALESSNANVLGLWAF